MSQPCWPVTKPSTPRCTPCRAGQLRAELIACLRQARKRRRPRARGEDRQGNIPNRISIHGRPAEIDERIVPGHWAGDLIKEGARNASSVATLAERTSLFVILGKMKNVTADAAVTSFGMMLNRIDAQRRLFMTYDQGHGRWPGMSSSARPPASRSTSLVRISAWQRGRNENTNGLLRQYMPKGTELAAFSQAELFIPESFDVRQHHHEIVALGDALRA
ncbi:MAG: IS30 family transposase [Burkholderia sp.]